MRVLMKVSIPVEAGNAGIKDGSLPKTIMEFTEQVKPEAAYFTPLGGTRTALFVFDMADPSEIPPTVEPFFLKFNAAVDIVPVMDAADLKAGIEKAAQQQ